MLLIYLFLQTEDTYDLLLSVWNPLMGWVSSKPTVVEVLERVGPITIDDFRILSDYVSTIAITVYCFLVFWHNTETQGIFSSFSGFLKVCSFCVSE